MPTRTIQTAWHPPASGPAEAPRAIARVRRPGRSRRAPCPGGGRGRLLELVGDLVRDPRQRPERARDLGQRDPLVGIAERPHRLVEPLPQFGWPRPRPRPRAPPGRAPHRRGPRPPPP